MAEGAGDQDLKDADDASPMLPGSQLCRKARRVHASSEVGISRAGQRTYSLSYKLCFGTSAVEGVSVAATVLIFDAEVFAGSGRRTNGQFGEMPLRNAIAHFFGHRGRASDSGVEDLAIFSLLPFISYIRQTPTVCSCAQQLRSCRCRTLANRRCRDCQIAG